MKISVQTRIVILLTFFIGVSLSASTWNINFIPSDAKNLYWSAAKQLPSLNYISEIHKDVDKLNERWLHGKEFSIVNFSLFQKLLSDTTSLRPLILTCIFYFCLSSLLIFFIAKQFWQKNVALICYLLFISSFWPYMYVLFVAHQTIGLFYFLFAIFILLKSPHSFSSNFNYILSGLLFSLSIFSSPNAIIYFPYLFATIIFLSTKKSSSKIIACPPLLILGGLLPLVYFNYPNITGNLNSFLEHLSIGSRFSHFYYNQSIFQQWIEDPSLPIRGGILWVFKYFNLIMPVLFPTFLFSIAYLSIKTLFKKQPKDMRNVVPLLMIILSLSAVMLAELKGVAQYGRNYFPAFVGIILLIGYFLSQVPNLWLSQNLFIFKKNSKSRTIIFLLIIQIITNGYIFISDIFPSRMATTFISNEIHRLKTKTIYTNTSNFLTFNLIEQLNPKIYENVNFFHLDNIYQMNAGHYLVAPVIGSSLYLAMLGPYVDFDEDLYLNDLIEKQSLAKYATKRFKTIASSRYWLHEEETLSYRDLMLHHFSKTDFKKGYAWLLDLNKLSKENKLKSPSTALKTMVLQGVRNIGTHNTVYKFKGRIEKIEKEKYVEGLTFQMYKIGKPNDSLTAYLYKFDIKQNIWLPHTSNYISKPITSKNFTTDPNGSPITFTFDYPLTLPKGLYQTAIYRNGTPDNTNFYRTYISAEKRDKYIKASLVGDIF